MIETEENKGAQILDDILGAVTFNLTELCRLDDLYIGGFCRCQEVSCSFFEDLLLVALHLDVHSYT